MAGKKFIVAMIAMVSLFVCNNIWGQSVQLYDVTRVAVEKNPGGIPHCYAYAGEQVRDEIHPLVYNQIKSHPTDFQFVVVTDTEGKTVNSLIQRGDLNEGVFEVEHVAIDPDDESVSLIYFVGKEEPLKGDEEFLLLNPGQKIKMVEFVGLNHSYRGLFTVPRETETKPFGPVEVE